MELERDLEDLALLEHDVAGDDLRARAGLEVVRTGIDRALDAVERRREDLPVDRDDGMARACDLDDDAGHAPQEGVALALCLRLRLHLLGELVGPSPGGNGMRAT